MLWIWNTFYDKYWNFDNSNFVKLLEEARNKQYKKQKWKNGFANKDISLFNSASKKEVWQFINKLSIFITSWIDIKGALMILQNKFKILILKQLH